ncbi:hypothetical protein J4G33_04900 [Actinotalea sp. BY-33]|uniref:Peptidase M23 n=1 Tax=Actinotalea soli TaxID=2819234 RepID=A0A939LMV2_9CELL|nr:hypothetical protein [Actinotalea soli]MBO1751137.1 hypothetical protein [Actinotalea soli]
MDGIAAISARIATLQGTLNTLGGTARTTQAAPSTSAVDFASVLAAQTAATQTAPTQTVAMPTAATQTAPVQAAAAPTTPANLPTVPGYTAEQVGNAAAVVETGRTMGLSLRDQALAVMTAMGESSLRVLDHGDTAGPDSRGLFQQRDNGAWGTLAERMDPAASSRSFYSALARVEGRETMAPTLVAHTVQRNADPQHYARYWEGAVSLVARITGTTPAQVTAG